jgi:type IV secretion system protein VirB8
MSDRDAYYAAARGWAEGASAAADRSRRVAWIVAGVAAGVAALLALALVMLMPLKQVQPYVLSVDRQTGAIEAATTLEGGRLTQNEAVIQAQLAAYVVARETFDATDLAAKYRQTQLLSAGPVARAYVQAMAADNPASPLKTLGAGDTVAVSVKSVSLIGPGAALVRFDAQRRAQGGVPYAPQAYAAAISYGFSGAPLRQEDRFANPLGFQVTRYRRDAEGLAR